jgi:hypothetical protein
MCEEKKWFSWLIGGRKSEEVCGAAAPLDQPEIKYII